MPFWTLWGGGGAEIGKARYRKMRVSERKRMSLLARQSDEKWRNVCETNRQKERQTLEAFINRLLQID